MQTPLNRRSFVSAMTAAALPLFCFPAKAEPAMLVHRDANCSCCEAWVAHLRSAGINTTVVNEANMNAIKTRLRVPDALMSCHTAEIGGYVVEGHVPAKAVLRLIHERPDAIGLAAPGMPVGSPGMENSGANETFDIMLFSSNGTTPYGRYRGAEAI